MVRINGYLIDAAITEEHSHDSEVTTNPVEDGADVTDNIRTKPAMVSMECRVSDSPLAEVAGERTEGVLPSDEARAKLEAMVVARQPITVITSIRTYTNMAITTLGEPRNSKTLGGMWFRVSFQAIEYVSNERTTVRTARPGGKKKVNLGNKASPAVGGSAKAEEVVGSPGYQDSLLGQITDSFGVTSGPAAPIVPAGTF
jgi:hypothetical protein